MEKRSHSRSRSEQKPNVGDQQDAIIEPATVDNPEKFNSQKVENVGEIKDPIVEKPEKSEAKV